MNLQEEERKHEKKLVEFSVDEIKERSKIYKIDDPTRYQQKVNDAAFQLCSSDVSLILNRGKLFEEARKKVDSSGYEYVKKSSRSTVYGTAQKPTKQKRKYISAEIRASRILQLNEGISSLKETLDLLRKQKEQYSNAEKFL